MTRCKRLAALIALPVLLLLGGCELRTEVGVVVDGDGGGDLAVTLAADEELRRTAHRAGADPLSVLAQAGRELPGWDITRFTDGPRRAVTLSTTFADPDELDRVSTQFADAVAAPELRPLGPLRLVLEDATVELRGTVSLDVGSGVRELGVRPARAREVLADSVVLRVVARMPGDVLETNADRQRDDGVVEWTIPAGRRRTLRVVARRPWTPARLARLLVTVEGMVALTIGTALIYDWRRATRHRAPL